jgi:hypothetical protein
MSYAPRTKLSCDSSYCTVLNDDYVFITWGLGINQRMPLADWRIIIGDEPVREEFIPLAAAEPIGRAPTVWSAPEPIGTPAPERAADAAPTVAALAVAAAAAAAAPAPINTKWRWATDQNYCVAIQTKYGVLQVKKFPAAWSPLLADLGRKNFPTYEAWVDSLPQGGTITKTPVEELLSELDRRKKQSIALLDAANGGGTASAIEKIQKMWKVRTWVNHTQSVNQRIARTEDHIGRMRGDLQRLTIEEDMTTPKLRRSLSRRLEKFMLTLTHLKGRAAQQSPEQNAHREIYISDAYKERLYIHTSEGKLQIAYDHETKSVAVKVPNGPYAWSSKISLVQKLEDLPFSIGTGLRLSVLWRRREIELAV